MMKEIGSEFWDVPILDKENDLFPKNTQWYISGRSALTAIISSLKDVSSVAIPSWCCESMIKPFVDFGIEVRFYPVYFHDGLVQEVDYGCDCLFIMDYFGYTSELRIPSEYRGVVIRDVTHSLFSKQYNDADFYFGSLRKWCGVWTGGYAWKKDGGAIRCGDKPNMKYVNLRKQAMEQKKIYICTSDAVDKSYLKLYDRAEDILDMGIDISVAHERDVQAAKFLDIENIKKLRRHNAKIIIDAFTGCLIFRDMKYDDCPMFVPILVPAGKRDKLRRYLIEKQIYCPVHWTISEYHRIDDRASEIYENELSLICDQRYGEEDMTYLISSIKQFMTEK